MADKLPDNAKPDPKVIAQLEADEQESMVFPKLR